MRTPCVKHLLVMCMLGLGVLAYAGTPSLTAQAATDSLAESSRMFRQSCDAVASATDLSTCITAANADTDADTITLGADIALSAALPNITSEIVIEGAGYYLDGGWDGVAGSDTGYRVFYVESSGNLSLNNITIQNGYGTEGGGIYNPGGRVTVTYSTFSSNYAIYGGGIHSYGTLIVTNSTFSGNSAFYGGGIFNHASGGTLTVTNSTFSGNTANYYSGGGIYNNLGTLTVTSSTFAGNTAGNGGGGVGNAGTAYLAGNIFAAGTSGDNCTNTGTITDNGYNLSTDATCVSAATSKGSVSVTDLNLGGLADNGGSTLTHLPGTDSVAIGAISNGTAIQNPSGTTVWTCGGASATDQIGSSRPINSGDDCTIGAVEVPFVCTFPATVSNENDLSTCITAANADSVANTITLGADITLTAALPNITSVIVIEGAGYALDGGGSVRVLYVGGGGNLTVNAATIQNGYVSDSGGGIYNGGTLTVTNSTLSGNSAYNSSGGASSGGGIYNGGALTVTNSTFSGNSAANSSYGDSCGGGVYNYGALTLTNSTFSGNSSSARAGGIYNHSGSTLLVSTSTFSGNSARAMGGGIYNENGTLRITTSTFSGNSSNSMGGGIFSYGSSGTLTATSSTFVNNSASRGSGFYNFSSGKAYLAGNIFANTSGDNCTNSGGTLTDNGYNLSDDDSCGFDESGADGSADNATLNFGALSGGVHTPVSPSDAIGAISNGTSISNNGVTLACNSTTTDQLGSTRPVVSSAPCSAGAVEVAPLAFVCTLPATVSDEDELSNCITTANADTDADTITLGADIALSAALPNIISEIVIEGAGYYLDGGWEGISSGSGTGYIVLYVTSTGALTVNDVTIQHGVAMYYGGGIYNNGGTLTVTDVTFFENFATTGSGIANTGIATITNATFDSNYASFAGGIYNAGTLTVINSTFSDNISLGGGGWPGIGGGLANGGTATITGSTFSGNTADDDGDGGGIYNNGGTLTLTNSTLSGNTAGNGGGINNYQNGTVTVTSSTFYDNSATNGSSVYTNMATVNLAGNVFQAGTGGENCFNNSGTLNDNGYNLSTDATCVSAATSEGSVSVTDLNLGGLADNGGSTLTHLPGTDSVAIGAIPNGTAIQNPFGTTVWTCGDASATDQLGSSRPINSGDDCTVGAVEVAPLAFVCTLPATVTDEDQLATCIDTANSASGADTITLGAGITLSAALPNITSEIVIEGAGYALDGGWDGVAGSGTGYRVFYVSSSGDFALNNITVQHGNVGSDSEGGGVYNDGGTLTVTNSIFSLNAAQYGAGISNYGALSVTGSTFSNNVASGGTAGNNGGSAIANFGTSTVTNSTFSDNGNANTYLAGSLLNMGGTLTVTGCTFTGNEAYGGGAIFSPSGVLTVTNSTFSDNTAYAGAGVINGGTMTVTTSTFSDNVAYYDGSYGSGGALGNSGTLTVTSSTFYGNVADVGAGIYTVGGTLNLAGNIFQQGTGGENCFNDGGTLNDNGYNLSTDATCVSAATSEGSVSVTDLNLGGLADNGGSTLTHLPGTGSVAIGAILNGTAIQNPSGTTIWTCDQTSTDQTGLNMRPINSGDDCTIGAVEVAPLVFVCTLPATVTDEDQLATCIDTANSASGADTITLGAGITLSAALPNITSEIVIEGAGYYLDGGWDGVAGSDTGYRVFYVESSGNLSLNNITIQNGYGTEGGGIYNPGGRVTVSNSTFSSNYALYGGGIHSYGTLIVTNSTFSGNSAFYGGGIFNHTSGSTVTVTNSTFSGNAANYYSGGGILNSGTLTVTSSTFADNTAGNGGGGVGNAGTAYLAGNIFAAGTSGDNCTNTGTLNDNGYNLSTDATCVSAATSKGSVSVTDLKLGGLADNGGSTLTHLPGTGSVAIGAIPNGTAIQNPSGTTIWTCDQTSTDQTGLNMRPINSGDPCTAGAVEVTFAATVSISANDDAAAENPLDVGQFTVTMSKVNTTNAAINVTYTVSGTAASGTDYTALSGAVSIPIGSDSAVIDVTPVDDTVGEPVETVIVTLAGTSHTRVTVGTPDSATVNITDNDAANISVSPASVTTSEDGTIAMFDIVLTSQPTAEVQVTFTSGDTTEGLLSTNGVTAQTAVTLTFTDATWNTAQTITVHGQDDTLQDGNANYSIAGVTTSSDTDYDALTTSVSVMNTDNDTAGVTVDLVAATVTEGGTSTFTVVLNTEPTADSVVIDLTGTAECVPDVTQLTFTTTDWDTAQTVTVTVTDNTIAEGEHSCDIALTMNATTADSTYRALDPADVVLTIYDDDSPGVRVEPTAVTVKKNTAVEFTVVLNTEPTADSVVIDLASDDTDCVPDLTQLTFTTADWDTAQTVTVAVKGGCTISLTMNSTTADSNYLALEPDDVVIKLKQSNTTQYTAEDHARAQAPLCADLDGSTNPIIRADVPNGTVTEGSVFCRVLAQDGTFATTTGAVGDLAVLERGVIQAVDVFGLRHDGASVPQFSAPVTLCLQGSGVFLFLDAMVSPRTVTELPVYTRDGYTCATVPNAGTIVLVRGATNATVAAPVLTGPATALTDCMVTTRDILNLRDTPSASGAVLCMIPYDVTLTALQQADGWYYVDYNGERGWISAGYVTPQDSCGQ